MNPLQTYQETARETVLSVIYAFTGRVPADRLDNEPEQLDDDQATAALTTAAERLVVQELEYVLEHSAGGGSWRRVLAQRIASYKPKEEKHE